MPVTDPPASEPLDVIAFGANFLELVFGHISQLPGPGEEIFTDEFAISCGGGSVTVASTASRCGVRAGLGTVLGTDLGSRVVWEFCRREGLDVSPSARVAGPAAGITVVINFNSDRAFISHLPRLPAVGRSEVQRWREVLRQRRPRWAYLHAGPGVLPLMVEARELGISVALDAAFPVVAEHRAEVVECSRLATVCVPNEKELCHLAEVTDLGAALRVAAGWGTDFVVKRGPAGALVLRDGQVTEVLDGLLDVTVRDRTGAGDAFAGAMIASLVQGRNLLESAAAGNSAGSLAVARLGAVGEVEIDGLSVDGDDFRSMPWWEPTLGVPPAGQAGGGLPTRRSDEADDEEVPK